MNTREFWFNKNTRLFRTDETQLEFLRVGVWRVLWRGKNERVILCGHLPDAKWLDTFPEGCTLEIQYGECGDPMKYVKDRTIMRFCDCTVRNKWIHKPVIMSIDEYSTIDLFVEVNCTIETFS